MGETNAKLLFYSIAVATEFRDCIAAMQRWLDNLGSPDFYITYVMIVMMEQNELNCKALLKLLAWLELLLNPKENEKINLFSIGHFSNIHIKSNMYIKKIKLKQLSFHYKLIQSQFIIYWE